MKNLFLEEFTNLYNLFSVEDELDTMEIYDALEELLPTMQEVTVCTSIEQMGMASDDTTQSMLTDYIRSISTLVPQVEEILAEYNGIDNKTINVFVKELQTVIISASVIYYKTYAFEDVIDNLAKTGQLKLAEGIYSKEVISIVGESTTKLTTLCSIICYSIQKFQVYLPEYLLNDEEMADVQEAIFNANLPSNAIATLSPAFIERVLGGEVIGAEA